MYHPAAAGASWSMPSEALVHTYLGACGSSRACCSHHRPHRFQGSLGLGNGTRLLSSISASGPAHQAQDNLGHEPRPPSLILGTVVHTGSPGRLQGRAPPWPGCKAIGTGHTHNGGGAGHGTWRAWPGGPHSTAGGQPCARTWAGPSPNLLSNTTMAFGGRRHGCLALQLPAASHHGEADGAGPGV